MFRFSDCYKSYLHLDHRTDRLLHMTNELNRIGIEMEITKGKLPKDFDLTDPKLQVMKNRTPGAVPCHYGQIEIMTEALKRGKPAFVTEDDVVFCSDWNERMVIVEDFLNSHPWDIFWGGGTYSVNPAYWHKAGHNSELTQCECTLGKDAECTDNPRIMRTYGCFSTFGYIVRYESIEKVLRLMEETVHLSMGIDWNMILHQPNLHTYCFAPGMMKQIDNMSDIGRGVTVFSGFASLGAHWYADKMDEFNPNTYNWHEAKIN